MEVIETPLKDCYILVNNLFQDPRGFFMEAFNQGRFEDKTGVAFNVKQVNFAQSEKKVLRGLHYQLEPAAQAKLVGVVSGSVLDVVVDVRESSPTFGQKFEFVLNGPARNLFVPRGFAHGYEVREDNTLFYYAVDNYYSPADERGILYSDPALGISWKWGSTNKISEKDETQPLLKDAELNFK